jgi:uncharacterized cupredoxin-like copper-binding protein
VRTGVLGALAIALALAGSANAPARSGSSANVRSAASSYLQVIQVEYHLLLSRGVVRAGPVSLEALDRGMDPHDLRLQQQGSNGELAVPELTPGRRWDGTVRLKPGYYRLWCSLPEHARLGMHATLRVIR